MAEDRVAHYTRGEIETIDYIYDQLGPDGGLDYVLGNILKYASRAKHKGQLESDLKKIAHYAQMASDRLPLHTQGAGSEPSFAEYKLNLRKLGKETGCNESFREHEDG